MTARKNLFAALFLCAALAAAGSAGAYDVKLHHHSAVKDCSLCHTQENAVGGNAFVVPDDKACMSCHGSYKDLAGKTANLASGEPNPHKSHHYGEGIACTACHKEHRASKAYCNECHEFKYQLK